MQTEYSIISKIFWKLVGPYSHRNSKIMKRKDSAEIGMYMVLFCNYNIHKWLSNFLRKNVSPQSVNIFFYYY
jgi:uncharacterized protein with PQ loop repeat